MTPECTATNRNGRRQKLASIILLLTYFATVLANQEPESHIPADSSIEPNTNIVGEQPSAADKRTPWSYAFAPSDSYSYSYLPISADEIYNSLRPSKRGLDDAQMPGVLSFGKRAQAFIRFGRSSGDMMMDDGASMLSKKDMPGVLRFGKRGQQEKKAVPGVLRFGKRESDIPGVLRFGKRDSDIPGVLRFGKRGGDMPGVLRFGKRYSSLDNSNYLPAGVLRFGKRSDDIPGVLRFGKKSEMPGVLRFGKRSSDMPGVLRFGKRSSDMPGVLRFG